MEANSISENGATFLLTNWKNWRQELLLEDLRAIGRVIQLIDGNVDEFKIIPSCELILKFTKA